MFLSVAGPPTHYVGFVLVGTVAPETFKCTWSTISGPYPKDVPDTMFLAQSGLDDSWLFAYSCCDKSNPLSRVRFDFVRELQASLLDRSWLDGIGFGRRLGIDCALHVRQGPLVGIRIPGSVRFARWPMPA